MKPMLAGEHFVPVYLAWFNLSNPATGTIIDDFGWALGSPAFEIKNSEAFPSAQYMIGVNSKLPNIIETGLPNLRRRHSRNHVGLHSKIGKRNGRIGFRAGVADLEFPGLNESLESFGGQAH